MSFLKAQNIFLALIVSTLLAGGAWATPVGDNYIGGTETDPSNRDVIGNQHEFDIYGANVQRDDDWLHVRINTKFAGLAGGYESFTDTPDSGRRGIGYGDLFLAPAWTPSGTVPYMEDNHTNGTSWTHAFSLDDRWDNGGGEGQLLELNASANILLSNTYISNGGYRSGQEVAVLQDPNLLIPDGTWTVSDSNFIEFAINIGDAEALMTSEFIAFHWTMTCGNDVIEGQVPNSVPEPSSILLLGLGLIGIAGLGRGKLRAK